MTLLINWYNYTGGDGCNMKSIIIGILVCAIVSLILVCYGAKDKFKEGFIKGLNKSLKDEG